MKKFLYLLTLTLFVFTSCEQEEIIDVNATANKKLPKITICHYDADADSWHTITINENALKAHLKHGDYIGACNENEKTYVPDDNFENYLETHDQYDEIVEVGDLNSMGDGIANNDYVLTANISEVISLSITIKAITDLTGIEDFISLISLYSQYNSLETLDVTQNINLETLNCFSNQITNLDVNQNTALTKLSCGGNKISSLDLSQNIALADLSCEFNQLTSLDLSQNLALKRLICGSNQISSLDLSQNTLLIHLHCCCDQLTSLDLSKNTALEYLVCAENQLTSLDVRNGNNSLISTFWATYNPSLTCIQVDDYTVDHIVDSPYNSWQKDNTANYSKDCGY